MERSESIGKLALALSKAQAEMRPAIKDAVNPHFKSKYADLASVWEAARAPLAKQELTVVQLPTESEEGRVALTTVLMHSSGEYIGSTYSTRLVKNDAQGVGSALTYLRRYALAAILGIVADEDDDGNAASEPQSGGQAAPPFNPREARAKIEGLPGFNPDEHGAKLAACRSADDYRALYTRVERAIT